MKPFRFAALALTAGLALPTAANAESVWLVLVVSVTGGNVLESIEMKDMDQQVIEIAIDDCA